MNIHLSCLFGYCDIVRRVITEGSAVPVRLVQEGSGVGVVGVMDPKDRAFLGEISSPPSPCPCDVAPSPCPCPIA